jgi:hypothetical protein
MIILYRQTTTYPKKRVNNFSKVEPELKREGDVVQGEK